MRILATSDLHYDIARSKAPTEALARQMCAAGGDVLLLVGDSAGADLAALDACLALFEEFRGARLATAGNHELWTRGGDSLHRYENEVAEVCSRRGFHYLDAAPYRADGVAIVGSVGWYDYSFRTAAMKVPLRFYQHKIAPGAAARLVEYEHLAAHADDVPVHARDLSTRWMDGVRVRLGMSDVQFTHYLTEKLRRHLDHVHEAAGRVVAAVHHLPFYELAPHSVLPNFEFAAAFFGSELLGEALLDYPKISHVYCGHTHRYARCRRRHIECVCIGSTYQEKRYEVLDV